MAAIAERKQTKRQQALSEAKASMTESLMRHLLSVASDREEGLVLNVRPPGGVINLRVTQITFKAKVPSHTRILSDGRLGFCIEGQSYVASPEESKIFLGWLMDANSQAIQGGDYGQPSCTFTRRS